LEILFSHEAAAKLDAVAMKDPAGLESSVGSTKCLCQEVNDFLAKVWSTLDHVHDISAPESTSNNMTGILEALAVKEGSEDPLVTVVRQQVTIVSVLDTGGIPVHLLLGHFNGPASAHG
jgi:hypothetical protein